MEGGVSWEPGALYSALFVANVALACAEFGVTKLWFWEKKEVGGPRKVEAGGAGFWPSSAITSSMTTNSISL